MSDSIRFQKYPHIDCRDIGKLLPDEARQQSSALREGIDHHDVQRIDE